MKLTDICEVIRSKNSGPYELVLDMVFRRPEDYERVKASGFFTRDLFARLYATTPDRVIDVIFFDPACAVKVTMVRPIVSGDPGDTDVYGAQQHAPLLGMELP